MTILGSIDEGTPLGELARAQALPCCSLVACILLEQAGYHPDPATLDAYADADPVYWPPANVWSRDAPWSALTAARALLRGRWAYESLVGEREGAELVHAPQLTPGRWHVVQRWRGLELGEGIGPQDDEVIDGYRRRDRAYLSGVHGRGALVHRGSIQHRARAARQRGRVLGRYRWP
jgi:hypothetical protein